MLPAFQQSSRERKQSLTSLEWAGPLTGTCSAIHADMKILYRPTDCPGCPWKPEERMEIERSQWSKPFARSWRWIAAGVDEADGPPCMQGQDRLAASYRFLPSVGKNREAALYIPKPGGPRLPHLQGPPRPAATLVPGAQRPSNSSSRTPAGAHTQADSPQALNLETKSLIMSLNTTVSATGSDWLLHSVAGGHSRIGRQHW